MVFTDSSDHGLAGVIAQKDDDGKLQVVALFTRKLTSYERNSSVHNKEALGRVAAPLHFSNHSMQGLHLVTDQQALTYLLDAPPSRVQNGWAAAIRHHVLSVEWTPGASNVVADALSRRPDYAQELAKRSQKVSENKGNFLKNGVRPDQNRENGQKFA